TEQDLYAYLHAHRQTTGLNTCNWMVAGCSTFSVFPGRRYVTKRQTASSRQRGVELRTKVRAEFEDTEQDLQNSKYHARVLATVTPQTTTEAIADGFAEPLPKGLDRSLSRRKESLPRRERLLFEKHRFAAWAFCLEPQQHTHSLLMR
ncbi:unnamed protein product, partial [Ectocarpus sp. 8 AP-2014]